MSPIRLFLLCSLLLFTTTIAHADDPKDLITRVRSSITASLPCVAEGTLQTQFKDEKISRFLKCCRHVVNGMETEYWSYQGVNLSQGDGPNFFVVLPNELVDPLEPVSGALTGPGAGKAAGMRILGKEQIDGADYDVLEITQTPDRDLSQQIIYGGAFLVKSVVRKLYIGHEGLVHRIAGELIFTDAAAPAGKQAPEQKAQFVLNITTFRKAILFAPRPDSQPVAHAFVFQLPNNWLPRLFGISQDGRMMAFGLPDSDIFLGDSKTGKAGVLIKRHLETWKYLALSPDGSRLILSDSMTTTVWNTDSGKALYTFHDLPDVSSLTFTPDGKSVLVTTNSSLVQLREVETGQVQHTFDQHAWGQYTFSPDGAYLAASIGFRVMLWNTKTWQPIPVEGENIPTDGRIAFSSGSGLFALGSHYGVLSIWETRTGKKIKDLKGSPGGIHAAWFSPDGQSITALDTDSRGDASDNSTGITSWNTTSWQQTGSLKLTGGHYVQQGYPGAVGNTYVLPGQLVQFDDSAHSINFWTIPVVPARH